MLFFLLLVGVVVWAVGVVVVVGAVFVLLEMLEIIFFTLILLRVLENSVVMILNVKLVIILINSIII